MIQNQFKKYGWPILILTLLVSLPLIWISCEGKSSSTEMHHGKALYQCSMHPQITSDKPDNCPICGMRLTRVDQPSASPKKPGDRGKILYYQHPMNPSVTSPKPAKDEMGMDYVPVYENDAKGVGAISIPGHGDVFISPERRQLIGLQTAVVEKKSLTFTIRTSGAVAHDPELYSTFTEYRQAAMAYEKVKESPLPQIRERAQSLLHAAEFRLKLAGLSEDQMKELLTSGPEKMDLLLPTETLWIYADIYAYESGLVKPGQKAKISSPAFPKMQYEGDVKTVDAILNAMTRSLRVRIAVADKEKLLKPEMFVDVTIEVPLGENLAVPEQAVVDAGETKLVFVDKGEGMIEPREVKAGYIANGFYEILSGLSEGEKVISSANFLIDSESRFRAAAQSFKSGESSKPDEKQKAVEPKQTSESMHAHE